VISPATADDADGVAKLLRAVYDDGVYTPAGIRYRISNPEHDERREFWKVEHESAIVGWASAGLDAFSAERGRAFATVVVHPTARRRGFGGGLSDVVADHLEAVGSRQTRVETRGDDPSERFVATRGFRRESVCTLLVADPRDVPRAPAPAGVTMRAMSAFEDDPQPLFECDVAAAEDEPGPFDFGGITFDAWRRFVWDHPDTNRDLSIAAIVDDVVAGVTFVMADAGAGRATNAGTGVLPAYRGRGLGLALKQASLARAREAGITAIVTSNDDTNAPMLAINRRLAYQRRADQHWWVRET
jgi:N-acetylglutamate synthase-like GNAT family acetyltransferase